MAEKDSTNDEAVGHEKLEELEQIYEWNNYENLKSATIIQYTIKGRFMSR